MGEEVHLKIFCPMKAIKTLKKIFKINFQNLKKEKTYQSEYCPLQESC